MCLFFALTSLPWLVYNTYMMFYYFAYFSPQNKKPVYSLINTVKSKVYHHHIPHTNDPIKICKTAIKRIKVNRVKAPYFYYYHF